MHQIADDFWNIRGSFKIGGLIDIGTHASLVRRRNGRFVFLDAYSLTGAVEREVGELTHGGKDVEAILNLHPFHTVHVRKMHEQYPHARLYGTVAAPVPIPLSFGGKRPTLKTPSCTRRLPRISSSRCRVGVDFISANENVHFSSVLVLHRASKTIHVDDTLMYIRLPRPARRLGLTDTMSFHPTLAKALERRAGAAQDFRDWAADLSERWRDAENLCAAHTATLTARKNHGPSIPARLDKALGKVSRTLAAHERRYG